LFIQVCNAVQHAHRKGIIHRDIKPSNVMVTHHDGKPVPKVIDFGIAKATNQRLTEKTLFTRYAHLIGTPAYMSPEQAELSDLDIDTRTDIYSLGVLLYELLTGTTPFSEEELRKAGYIEMQRVIREQEPAKPSTKLSTLGDTLTDIAKHRGCTPDLLRRTVRGDLDWIVMKSLEKDRSRRYETPNSLASDILRHLEHEPVLARGPSATYRIERFLRRHRSQVVSALVLAVIAVAVGAILSLWNRDRAQLVEAEGFKHRGILSQAREQYAKADREVALETIKPILQSKHVGPEARLLQATIMVDNRRPDEAVTTLNSLLNERPEVAGAAHSLLARILWEDGSADAEKLKEIEEHRTRAEALLFGVPPSGGKDQSDPRKRGTPSAEAYFLRAMTAVTIKEQLASLDKALQLDPSHYESRRLRAFTYYASRRYNQLHDDAMVMTILRPREPLGYSLRAVARRELGRYPESITDYDIALELTPKEGSGYIDLCAERSETLLRMGEYGRVIAEAPQEVRDIPPLQYHVFCALTALGDYDKAITLFRQIIAPGHEARSKFRDWCAKHVFDTLEAGRFWHPAEREPTGAAFLPMVEAEETYRSLSVKARRVIKDSFSARWSPDGSKLAFSAGVHGYSGVALFDPATQETELLIVPGKNPTWSPDGRYLAFVRDCEFLRVSEFVAAERENQHRAFADEEVWVMKSDGTEPRRLARGGWPSWSRDSTTVYYHSRVDSSLYSIQVANPSAQAERIMACSSYFPSVSADNQRVAYLEEGSLQIKDMASQSLVAEYAMPSMTWANISWSPNGHAVCLGTSDSSRDTTGLWIYDLAGKGPVRVLDGQITSGSWPAKATDMAFCLGSPYYEIWASPLDANAPPTQSLGAGRTPDMHFRDMVALHTRRIEADPLDARAYADRARYYGYLQERTKENADVRRSSAIVNRGLSPGFRPGSPWTLLRAINGPSGHQLVIFVERQEEGIQVQLIAFGQKGRWEMRLSEVPTFVPFVLWLCLLSGLDTPPALANFAFGTPTNLGPVVNTGADVSGVSISHDGLSLYFCSNRPEGYGSYDLWVTTRETVDSEWGIPVNLGPVVNSTAACMSPSISVDGLSLYFSDFETFTAEGPLIPGGVGHVDVWVVTRSEIDGPWGAPSNLGVPINYTGGDLTPSISADALTLYFASGAGRGGAGFYDVWAATRKSTDEPWDSPVNLGPGVNTSGSDAFPCVSSDDLVLLFCSGSSTNSMDMYMSQRNSRATPWGKVVKLSETVNTEWAEVCPSISSDGRTLYYVSNRPGGYGQADIWQVALIADVDFNADGTVDLVDLSLLIENWGTADSLYDVGPMPWGDGVVDEKDLAVVMESLMTPGPKASDVSCDMILNWIGPSFADSYDVYFGTSFDDVNNASREDPCGVLVGEGQTETTYDPEGLLEFSQTYYWRVDGIEVVIGSLEPTVYRGPVLSFTTEAFAYPTQNVVATASSEERGRGGANRTVDGSGLDESDGHSTDAKDMWQSKNGLPQWIQFEFDQVCTLHELWVWNSNTEFESFMSLGAKDVAIEYSADGTTWTTLDEVPEFAKAPGTPRYMANTAVSFGGVSAKYVKLTINSTWGTTPAVGLSEVQFFYIPDRSVIQP